MTKFKKWLCISLVIIIVVVAFGAVATFAKNDTKSAGAIFKRGGLDETTGKYVETNKTIYTEIPIDAYGLRIEPNFESTVTYDVYYYDNTDKLLRVIKGLTDVYDEDFEVAEKCRIVIHPEIPDDVKEKDFEIGILKVTKYANMLKITNSKESNGIVYDNLYNKDTVISGAFLGIQYGEDGLPILGGSIYSVSTENRENNSITPVIELDKNIDGIICFSKLSYPPESWVYVFLADENGTIIAAKDISSARGDFAEGWHMLRLSETDTEEAVYARVCYRTEYCEDFYIYGYND